MYFKIVNSLYYVLKNNNMLMLSVKVLTILQHKHLIILNRES